MGGITINLFQLN